MPVDRFGVKTIYPDSKTNPQSWYLPHDDPTYRSSGDSQLIIPSGTSQLQRSPASGPLVDYWQLADSADNDDVKLYIATASGGYVSSSIEKDHAVDAARGYMMAASDWKCVEVTGYIYLVSAPNIATNPGGFTISAHGGKKGGSHNCEGSGMMAWIGWPGEMRVIKQPFYSDYKTLASNYSALDFLEGRWIGFKAAIYNTAEGHPKVEVYYDEGDLTNNWKLAVSAVDSGHNDAKDDCGTGVPTDQEIKWGGPVITLAWDKATQFRFKFLSVREIDPFGSFEPGGGGSTNPPGGTTIHRSLTIIYNVNFSTGDSCQVGGNVEVGPYYEIYNAAADTGAYYTIPKDHTGVGALVRLPDAGLVDKTISKVKVSLKKFGAPVGTVYCRIRSSQTLDILQEFTTHFNIATLSTTTDTDVEFVKDDAAYTVKQGDLVLIEFAGGDATNYLMVKVSSTDKIDGQSTVLATTDAGTSLINTLLTSDFAAVMSTHDHPVVTPPEEGGGGGTPPVVEGNLIYSAKSGGFYTSDFEWHGSVHDQDGLRAQINDWPNDLVNHETTWTNVVFKDDPAKYTSNPWMSLKDGTHSHSNSSDVLYELSFLYAGGFKDFRVEQGNKIYKDCTGGTTYNPPVSFRDGSFHSGSAYKYSFKFVRYNKPDGSAVVTQYWVKEPGSNTWRKVGQLVDGSGLCGIPPIGLSTRSIPGSPTESVLRANGADFTVEKVEMYEIEPPADGQPL